MSKPVLEARELTKRFGGLVAVDRIDLAVAQGEIHAIIGPNGAGKTTLVAQLAGQLRPTFGSIFLDGQDVTSLPMHRRAKLGIGRSFQITSVFLDFTALENVSFAVQARCGHSLHFWKPAAQNPVLQLPALRGLAEVGLEDRADASAAELSHGERRQLEIAMTLAIHPRILLLDEPMAGMGVSETKRIIELLAGLKRQYTVLLVEHDMSAVFALADRITVLVSGRVAASGTPTEIRSNPVVQDAYLGTG
jgi:branched-chain amino acid transport system ATP-binding protein